MDEDMRVEVGGDGVIIYKSKGGKSTWNKAPEQKKKKNDWCYRYLHDHPRYIPLVFSLIVLVLIGERESNLCIARRARVIGNQTALSHNNPPAS